MRECHQCFWCGYMVRSKWSLSASMSSWVNTSEFFCCWFWRVRPSARFLSLGFRSLCLPDFSKAFMRAIFSSCFAKSSISLKSLSDLSSLAMSKL